MTLRKLILAALCLVLSLPAPAAACTVFASTDGSVTLAGNNEDWYDGDTYIWFLPGEGDSYGRVCYGFENAHPQGGMNEAGLFFDWFAYGGELSPPLEGQTSYQGDLSDLLLETCATVDEALDLYGQYHEPSFGYASILLADGAGDMATITWDWEAGKPVVSRGKGSLAIGVGKDRVQPMLEEPDGVTEESFRQMLFQAHNRNTLYSTLCDLNARRITVFSRHDFSEEVVFDLDTELSRGPHVLSIPALFSQSGEIDDTFTPWNLRPAFANGLLILLGVIFLLSVIAHAALLCRGKAGVMIPTAGIAGGLFFLAAGLWLNPHLFFASKYGLGILGPGAALLPWAALCLALLQTAAASLSLCRWGPARIPAVAAAAASILSALYLFTLL